VVSHFTHRILALSNLFVLLVLAADAIFLPIHHIQEIYDRRYSTRTEGYRYQLQAFSTDYIKAKSGDEFQVPPNWQNRNIGLNDGDTFYVDKSILLRQPAALYFPWKGGFARMRINVLNNGYWGRLMFFYILAVSLLHLLPRQIVKNDDWNERLIFYGTGLAVVLLFYYFYH
jgi:hypothetical protein